MSEPEERKKLPTELARKLTAARDKRSMEGERRVVTILFCDVKDSTAIAENLDPEDWAEIMAEAFDYLIAPVYRYEGTVTRLLGDAILAFFGAPIAHEDDPQRAILAGLEILKSIQPFRKQIKSSHNIDFNIRVGINTGPVVVGEIGSDLKLEYTAIGDAINQASRMEQAAKPGTVQITENTQKLVAPLFEFKSLGGIEVKGKRQPIPAFRVLAVKEKPGRLRGIRGLEAPLIGRKDEFEKLRTLIDEVREGRGQIVSLIGEAGLGKTRLIEEAVVEWEQKFESGTTWISNSISFDTTRPYGLFFELARNTCGITEDHTPEEVREIIREMTAETDEKFRTRMTHAVEVLLTVNVDGEESSPEGEAIKRDLFESFLVLIESACSQSPLLWVCDDLHWADPASIELLLHLFQISERYPILILCALRPYRQAPGWQVKSYAETNYPHRYTEIELEPLSNEDSDKLIKSLLSISDLPAELLASILSKTEGNPFFLEEVIRELIDSEVVEKDETGMRWTTETNIKDIAIPDNVQSLLVARIDRLAKDARQTLQLASVIGRSFYYRVLKTIAEKVDILDDHLNTLQRVDLILEASRVPELEYLFRHDLTREAAYKSILRRSRRKYHKQVGEALEMLFPTKLEEEAHKLAFHFDQAKENPKAMNYYILAGDVAKRLFANKEALTHYDRARKLLKSVEAPSDQMIHLFISRGRVLELTSAYDEALANYDQMGKSAQARGDQEMELQSLNAQATLRVTINPAFDPQKGQILCDTALALAKKLENRQAEAKVYWNLSLLNNYTEHPGEAVKYGETALDIAREQKMKELTAFVLHDLSTPYITTGKLDRAKSVLEDSSQLWTELGNSPMLADNRVRFGMVYLYLGELDRSIPYWEEALEISLSTDNLFEQTIVNQFFGYAYFELGEWGKAIQYSQLAITQSEQVGNAFILITVKAALALAYGLLGDVDRGISFAKQAKEISALQYPPLLSLPISALINLHLLKGDIAEAETTASELGDLNSLRYRVGFPYPRAGVALVELALANKHYERALDLSNEVLDTLRANDFFGFISDLLYLKGRVLLAQGDLKAALSALEQARDQSETTNSKRILWQILGTLAEVESQLGHNIRAKKFQKQAQQVIEFVADNTVSQDLSKTFLNSPKVLAIMEE
ncbi:MAG: AAA family ATPase, partial [Chloroflexi bacterium]|nr:AAA family ATPase [Chloroflexota bacterium]